MDFSLRSRKLLANNGVTELALAEVALMLVEDLDTGTLVEVFLLQGFVLFAVNAGSNALRANAEERVVVEEVYITGLLSVHNDRLIKNEGSSS